MEAGGIALVNYGEHPVVWHTRLLLHCVRGSTWVILTPDRDIYEEELSLANADFTDYHYCGPQGHIPARIPAASVYGFAPMTVGEIGQYMVQGRAYAAALGAVAPAPPLAPAHIAAPPAAAAGVNVVDSWVVMEKSGHLQRGEVVAVDPTPLPPGTEFQGDRAIMPSGTGQVCLAKMAAADVAAFALEDLRVLPVYFDTEGTRRREFSQCVERMNGQTPAGGGLQLSGPPTCLNLMKSMRDQGFTPTTFHEHWMRSSEIPRGDRSTYEHECLSRVLEALICVDQLNVPSLQGAELVVRRMQVIREAHRISPSSPDYSAADHFMGWKYRKSGQGVDSELAQHVANELKTEAAIAKEARKAREEQDLRRRRNPPKKGGGEGGHEKWMTVRGLQLQPRLRYPMWMWLTKLACRASMEAPKRERWGASMEAPKRERWGARMEAPKRECFWIQVWLVE